MDLLRPETFRPVHPVKPIGRPGVLCPRCGQLTAADREECGSCAVIFVKHRITQAYTDGVPPHSIRLADTWTSVCQNYENLDVHHRFLAQARAEENLPVAAARYVALQKLMPNDALCTRMLGEVRALGESLLWDWARSERSKPPRMFPKIWLVPLLAGSLCLSVAVLNPVLTVYSGLGSLLIYVSAMARIFFRG